MNQNISVTYIDHYGDDHTPIRAARVSTLTDSYEPDPKRDLKLARYLLKNGHTSPFEHAGATFLIHCPLYVARQIMRHRTCSYNEVSRRYTSEDITFYTPQELHTQHERLLQCSTDQIHPDSDELIERIKAHQTQSLNLYHDLIESGVAREEARLVLPLSVMTKFYMSANLLNWLRFIKIRIDPHTQTETRTIAHAIQLHLSLYFPQIMELAQELWFDFNNDQNRKKDKEK